MSNSNVNLVNKEYLIVIKKRVVFNKFNLERLLDLFKILNLINYLKL